MIAKIIVHGENRFDALDENAKLFMSLEIDEWSTNSEFQLDLISDSSCDHE